MNTGLTKKGVGVTKILTHFEFDFKLNGIFAIFTERNQNSIWFYFLNYDIWFVGLLEGSTGPLFLLGLLRTRGHRDCPVWARSCLCPPLRHRPAPCQDLPHHQCGRLRGYDDVGRAYDSQRAEETLNNKMVSMFIFLSVAVFRHMLLQGFMRLQHVRHCSCGNSTAFNHGVRSMVQYATLTELLTSFLDQSSNR